MIKRIAITTRVTFRQLRLLGSPRCGTVTTVPHPGQRWVRGESSALQLRQRSNLLKSVTPPVAIRTILPATHLREKEKQWAETEHAPIDTRLQTRVKIDEKDLGLQFR